MARPPAIDIAPSFLTAEWRFVAMLTYAVDPAVLRPYVPCGTELDLWEGRALASVVGLLFRRTRLHGVPVPFHRTFPELNLRFYVRRQAAEGWRGGIVFIKEIVPRRAVALVARAAYNEPYVAMPMRYRVDGGSPMEGASVEYAWRHAGRWNRLRVVTAGLGAPPAAGSQEAFVTERYWGYTAQRDGGTVEYRVEHPTWRVWRARESLLDCQVAPLYGAPFVDSLGAPPVSACLADGSPVVVRRGRRL